jgi:hypothetical protein
MKAKLGIILFLISLALMATNNIAQGIISLICLAVATSLMNKHRKEVYKTVIQFEAKVTKLFKLD